MKQDNQRGFVSIVTGLVIMIILSLITIGFTQLMARNQRQALDRQLSAQAYYAAESGVNEALSELKVNPNYANSSCGTPLNLSDNVDNTCTLVNPAPGKLVYDKVSVNQNRPIVIKLEPASSEIRGVRITWSKSSTLPDNGLDDVLGINEWPPHANWNPAIGILKATVIPFAASTNSKQVREGTGVVLLRPRHIGATTLGYSALKTNRVTASGAECDSSSFTCKATIEIPPGNNTYLVLTSIYRDNRVEVEGLDAGNNVLPIKSSQVLIDSTGKVGDVLRRVQIRVPLNVQYDYPAGVLEAGGSVCKQVTVGSGADGTTVCEEVQVLSSGGYTPPPPPPGGGCSTVKIKIEMANTLDDANPANYEYHLYAAVGAGGTLTGRTTVVVPLPTGQSFKDGCKYRVGIRTADPAHNANIYPSFAAGNFTQMQERLFIEVADSQGVFYTSGLTDDIPMPSDDNTDPIYQFNPVASESEEKLQFMEDLVIPVSKSVQQKVIINHVSKYPFAVTPAICSNSIPLKCTDVEKSEMGSVEPSIIEFIPIP